MGSPMPEDLPITEPLPNKTPGKSFYCIHRINIHSVRIAIVSESISIALSNINNFWFLAAIGLLPNGLPPTGFPQPPSDNLATAATNKQSLQRRFLMQQTLETPSGNRLAPPPGKIYLISYSSKEFLISFAYF